MAKHHLLAAPLLLALFGCSESGPRTEKVSADLPSSPAEEAIPATAAEGVPEAASARDELIPPGVRLSGGAHQRSTHAYTTKAGQERRVLIYEFMEGDVDTMATALKRDMAAAGFSARDEADRGDGKTRVTFLKSDYGRVNAALLSDLGDKPDNPDAHGIFSLDIPVDPEVSGGGDNASSQ